MIFFTFSWGQYDVLKKNRTIDSIISKGHAVVWKDLEDDLMSCSKGRNKVCVDVKDTVGENDSFVLMDRDMFLIDFKVDVQVPFGIIGIYGRDIDVGGVDGIELVGDRRDRYVVGNGYVDTSRGVSSVLIMTPKTLNYIGGWNEDYEYSGDFWGMEDSEWIVRARSRGCEFVKMTNMSFGHFDHWLSDDKVSDLQRRLGNSIRQFELQYKFKWRDYCAAQMSVKEFIDERRSIRISR